MTAGPSRTPALARLTVRRATETDLGAIAEIGAEAFSGLRPKERADAWVRACWRAAPRFGYWVGESDGAIHGYILWMEKGGFRAEAVLELEQIAVRADSRGKGVGAEIVVRSLVELEEELRSRGSRLKLIEVTTGTEQDAVEFYRRTLGAEVQARLPDIFRGDELILVARR